MAQLKPVQDKLLTGVSNRLRPMGMVADQVLTPLQVIEKSGKIGKFGKEGLRIVNTLMGGRGKAPTINVVRRSTSTYLIDRHGLEGMVTPDDFANVSDPFDARADETDAITDMLMLGREKALADTLTSTATITQNVTLAGTQQYSDFASSDPLGDFLTARGTIKANFGLPPNGAIVPWEVAEVLRYHPSILDALGFKANRAGELSDSELASALKVSRLLIPMAPYNSAAPGQTDALSSVWGKHIVFFYAPPQASKNQLTLGYDITFRNRPPNMVFRSPIANPPESELIVVVSDYDQFLADVTGAYLIKDAIA